METLNRIDKITVREGEAKRILHDLGVNQEIEITSDPALLMKPQPFTKDMLKKEGIDSDYHLVGFSVREPGPAAPDLNIEQYHAILANTADYMVERFEAQILFVPMEGGENKDPQHSHAVISKMANAAATPPPLLLCPSCLFTRSSRDVKSTAQRLCSRPIMVLENPL